MTQIMVKNGRLIMREMQVRRERGEIDRQRESGCERDRETEMQVKTQKEIDREGNCDTEWGPEPLSI